jgi:hypothetical protein
MLGRALFLLLFWCLCGVCITWINRSELCVCVCDVFYLLYVKILLQTSDKEMMSLIKEKEKKRMTESVASVSGEQLTTVDEVCTTVHCTASK